MILILSVLYWVFTKEEPVAKTNPKTRLCPLPSSLFPKSHKLVTINTILQQHKLKNCYAHGSQSQILARDSRVNLRSSTNP